jgi:hypothetical protein
MMQTPGVVDAGNTLSPEVLVGIIGFAGAVLGSLFGVVGGVVVWWLQALSKRRALARQELLHAYEGLLAGASTYFRLWNQRALMPRPEAPPEAALRHAIARMERHQLRISIADGDVTSRILATQAVTVVLDSIEVPMATLDGMAEDTRRRHVSAVRQKFRDAQKRLLLHLESRFRLGKRTGSTDSLVPPQD